MRRSPLRPAALIASVVLAVLPGRPSTVMAADIEAGEDAVILEEILEIEILSPTEARERYRRKTRILTQRGADDHDSGSVYYNASRQVRDLRGAVTSPAGKRVEVKKQAVVDHSDYASYDLYSDARFKTIRLPGVVPGSIVEHSYEVEVRNLFYLQAGLDFQEDVPARLKRLSVRTPPSLPVRHMVRGAVPYRSEETDGAVVHTWEARDVPALKPETDMPPGEDVTPQVRIFPMEVLWDQYRIDARTWGGIARWYWELAKGRLEPAPEVTAKARELTQGVTDPTERTRRLFEFVQKNVNYVSIQLGIGGYQPHANGDVLKHAYGDCKDKATLLIAMLRAVDLRGFPVLILTRDEGIIDRDFPAPGFNHAIVAVPADAGYLFMDPTDDMTAFGDLPWRDQGANVLVVKDDGEGEIVETPLFPPRHNRRHRVVTAALSQSGDLTGTYVLEAHGQTRSAYLEILDDKPGSQEDFLEDHMAWLCPGAVMQSHGITRPSHPGDPLRIVIRFEVPRFATRAGLGEVLSPHLVRFAGLTRIAAYSGRRLPVFFEYLFDETSEVRLTLPPARTVRKVPADRELEGPGLRAGTRHEVVEEKGRQVLVIHRSVSVGRREIPVAEYAALREFLSALGQEESRAITLDPASPAVSSYGSSIPRM